MFRRYFIFLLSAICLCLNACIEDGFTLAPSDRPEFSVDTLKMGIVYTDELTTTHRFIVYNHHSKGLNLSQVSVSGDDAGLFRLNVDGQSGTIFHDMEIRANDSIFVFVAANLPENGIDTPRQVEAKVDFLVNGVVSSVTVVVEGQDVHRVRGNIIDSDTVFLPGKPYQIKDSLVVDTNGCLTVKAGAVLRFHDGAKMVVRGRLRCEGTADAPIMITGDRTGNVITDVSFDLMSRQWGGISFEKSSKGNYMAFTEVSNTTWGVHVNGDGSDRPEPSLTLHNCRLRNSGDRVLTTLDASIEAAGCEFAEAANGLLYIAGGNHTFNQCTVANYYLFSVIGGPAWYFPDMDKVHPEMTPTRAVITNTITYGLGADVTPGDLTGYEVYFNHCLFKSQGTDDANFIDCIWDTDPMYYTVREDYVFDYRLKPESPAIGAAYSSLNDIKLPTDYYGVPRSNDLGAYVYVAPEDSNDENQR